MQLDKKDIKVLVVDDIDNNISVVIRVLKQLGLSIENMFPKDDASGKVLKFSSTINSFAKDHELLKIFTLIKGLVIRNKIDIIFLDLNLAGNEDPGKTTGEDIIELFANSEEPVLAHLPIIVISKHSPLQVREGLSKMLPVLHIKKDDTGFNRDNFLESVEEKKLDINLIQIVKNYRDIRDSEEYQLDIKYIKTKLNNLNYTDKLDNIISVLNDIDSKTLEYHEKLKNLEIFNTAIIKTLPLLSQTKNVKKVLLSLEQSEIKDLMGDDFPSDLGNTLYSKIKEISNKEKDKVMDSVMKEIRNEVKDHISKEANFVDDDNILEQTTKLSIYLINKVTSAMTGDL